MGRGLEAYQAGKERIRELHFLEKNIQHYRTVPGVKWELDKYLFNELLF